VQQLATRIAEVPRRTESDQLIILDLDVIEENAYSLGCGGSARVLAVDAAGGLVDVKRQFESWAADPNAPLSRERRRPCRYKQSDVLIPLRASLKQLPGTRRPEDEQNCFVTGSVLRQSGGACRGCVVVVNGKRDGNPHQIKSRTDDTGDYKVGTREFDECELTSIAVFINDDSLEAAAFRTYGSGQSTVHGLWERLIVTKY